MQKKYNALDFKRTTCKKLKWDCKLTVKLHSLHQGHSFIFFFRIWDIITVIKSQYIKGAWVYIFFFHFTERSPCSNKRTFYCLRNLKILVGHEVCLYVYSPTLPHEKIPKNRNLPEIINNCLYYKVKLFLNRSKWK